MSDHGHEDWFRHSSDEALPQQEHAAHVNTTAIGLTLLAIVFGVLFTVVILSMYFVNYANTRKSAMNEGTASAEAFLSYRDQSDASLNSSGWVDRAAGTVNISLDDAIEGVVAEYSEPGMSADARWIGPLSRPTASTSMGDQHTTHGVDSHSQAAGAAIDTTEESESADG